MRAREPLQSGQFNHGFGFTFKQHGEYNNSGGRCGSEARMDDRVVFRNPCEQDAQLFQGALANEALAHFDALRLVWTLSISRQQYQRWLFLSITAFPVLHQVNGALLRMHEWSDLRQQHLADGDE